MENILLIRVRSQKGPSQGPPSITFVYKMHFTLEKSHKEVIFALKGILYCRINGENEKGSMIK